MRPLTGSQQKGPSEERDTLLRGPMNRTALAALVVGLTAVFFVTHCSSSPGSAPRTDAGSPDRLGGGEPEGGIETGPRTDAGGGRDTGTEGGSGDAGLQ